MSSRATVLRSILAVACLATLPADALLAQRPVSRDTATTLDSIVVLAAPRRYGAESQTGATFLDAPVIDIPQAVQTITRQQLRDQGSQSLSDVFRMVPSANDAAPRGQPYSSALSSIRGQSYPITVNGLRNRFGTDADGSMLVAVERIEVLKGPAGVLYGAEGLGGALNLVTRRPRRDRAVELGIGGGSWNTKRAWFDATSRVDTRGIVAVRVIGELERSDDVTRFNEINRENVLVAVDADRGGRLYSNVEFMNVAQRSPANTSVGLPVLGTVALTDRFTVDRRAYLGEPDIDRIDNRGTWLTATGGVRLGGTWTAELTGRWSEFDTEQERVFLGAFDSTTGTVERSWREIFENDDQYILRGLAKGELRTGSVAHRIAAGTELYWTHGNFGQLRRGSIGPIDPTNPQYGPQALPIGGGFTFDQDYVYREFLAQDLVTLTRQLKLLAGARLVSASFETRVDAPAVEDSPTKLTWQGGAVFQPVPTVSLFANYATGIDPAAVAGSRSRTDEAFRPEESRSVEAGVKVELPLGIAATASVFDLRRRNVLTTDPADPDFQVQTGEQRTRGVEVEGTFVRGGFSAQAGYAFLDGEILQDNDGTQGNTLGAVPRHRLTSWLRYERTGGPLRGAGLGAGFYAVARQFTSSANSYEVPAYQRVDVVASYALAGWRLDLALRNALNERYFTTRGFNTTFVFPGEPRALQITLSTRF